MVRSIRRRFREPLRFMRSWGRSLREVGHDLSSRPHETERLRAQSKKRSRSAHSVSAIVCEPLDPISMIVALGEDSFFFLASVEDGEPENGSLGIYPLDGDSVYGTIS